MKHHNTDHLDAAKAEANYHSALLDFKNKNEGLWHNYLLASLPIAAKISDDLDEIPQIAEQLADELLRKHRREWEAGYGTKR